VAWITTAHVDDLIGEDVRLAVSPDDGTFDAHERGARARVQSALVHAGYTVGTTLDDVDEEAADLLRELCLGQWVLRAFHGRKGFQVPPSIVDTFHMLAAVRNGDLPITGLTPNTLGGVGGVGMSDTDEDTGLPPVFTREAMKVY
jgi:hypothetical protein